MPNDQMMERMPPKGQMNMEDEASQADISEDTAEQESPSIFLTADQLGGKKIKPGDTVVLKATDVDPESGDVSFDLASGGAETPATKSGGYESDFEAAVPEE